MRARHADTPLLSDRAANTKRQLIRAIAGNFRVGITFPGVARSLAADVECASGRVLTEINRLRSFEDFEAIDVQEGKLDLRLPTEVNAVDENGADWSCVSVLPVVPKPRIATS